MGNSLRGGEMSKMIEEIRGAMEAEIRGFCQDLTRRVSERLSGLSEETKVEAKPTGWLDFWHRLESEVMERFEVDLSEVDEEAFRASDYWRKGMGVEEYEEKLAEALGDFESALENHGRQGLLDEMWQEDE